MDEINRNTINSPGYPLIFLNDGDSAEIVEFKINPSSAHSNSLYRLDEMGIRSGKVIKMLNNGNSNSILIKVDNSRIAISRKIAMKILVRKSE
jgi:ferrous iron transport protein A